MTIPSIPELTGEEIKIECEKQYKIIADAKKRLEALRSKCKHEKVHTGNYEWRSGSIVVGNICDNCGILISMEF